MHKSTRIAAAHTAQNQKQSLLDSKSAPQDVGVHKGAGTPWNVLASASTFKLYIFAAVLCTLYAADTVLVAYNYRFFSYNPPSSKLLLLAEAVKLLVASALYLAEFQQKGASVPEDEDHEHGLQPRTEQPSLWSSLLGPQPVKAMLVFAVPAVCYFITNNLSFYALQIMSAHTYTLMCDLKVITTGVLSYLVLDRHLNKQAVLSLGVLFAGICIGQYATTANDPASTAASFADMQQLLPGLLVMATIAMLSAVASVYTEWVMNFSSFRHESINLHNARMYVAGTLLNGLYYLQSGGSVSGFFDGMRTSHWAIVLMLALMGLITALLIKRYGTIIKVYASCVASLFAAGISHTLLHDPPAPLFYLGCCLAMFATLQLQRARAAAAEQSAGKPPKQPNPAAFRVAIGLPIVVSVLTLLLIGNITPASKVGQGRSIQQPRTTKFCPTCQEQQGLKPPVSRTLGGAVADADAAAAAFVTRLPPIQPTCLVSWGRKESLCPVMACSQDPSCTVHNTTCCAYFNLEMLKVFDEFMTANCLQGEYVTVYGTLLGAVRNKTILGHTQDIDLGLSLGAIQFLERNTSRMELWKKGYAFWYHAERAVWKMCPHKDHPSPIFRRTMVKENTGAWERRTKLYSAVYTDVWLMWPVSKLTTKCTRSSVKDIKAVLTPWWETAPAAATASESGPSAPAVAAGSVGQSPCKARRSQKAAKRSTKAQKFCLAELSKPMLVHPESRHATIANLTFPAPDNIEELMKATYGKKWRTPHLSYHGTMPHTPDSHRLRLALLDKLSLTTWGQIPWAERERQCKAAAKH